MKKYLAELVGTFILVFFGCGCAVVEGAKVGVLGIAIAFGFALIGAAYGIGPIAGCHINPAVSLGVWTAGRMKTGDLVGYIPATEAKPAPARRKAFSCGIIDLITAGRKTQRHKDTEAQRRPQPI